jgi:hypothetical protein
MAQKGPSLPVTMMMVWCITDLDGLHNIVILLSPICCVYESTEIMKNPHFQNPWIQKKNGFWNAICLHTGTHVHITSI